MSTPAGAERADENRYAVDSNRPAARKKPKHTNPKRGLAVLLALFLVLIGGIAATGHWTPKLGLDLEGGRTVVLEPVVTGGKSVNSSQVKQAVDIIRNRVDATGTSEAEVTTLGEKDIVVSIPGNPSQQVLDSLSRSSQLNFRAVIAAAHGSTTGTSPYRLPEVVNPSSAAKNGASGSASASPSSSASASASGSASSSPSSSSKDRLPAAFKTAGPANASDPAWGNEKVDSVWVKAGIATPSTTYNQLLQLYACTPAYQEVAAAAPDNKPTVMCAKEGNEKLLALLELTAIPAAARKKAGGYSMGMRQRLGLAAALLGDPRLLVLDEPANGLDPQGIHWMRGLLRGFADRGGTVLLSSHLLSEVQIVADELVMIGRGRIVAQGTKGELLAVALAMALGNGLGSGIVMTLGADAPPSRDRAQFLGAWRLTGEVGHAGGSLGLSAVTSLVSLPAAAVALGGLGLVGLAWTSLWIPRADRERSAA